MADFAAKDPKEKNEENEDEGGDDGAPVHEEESTATFTPVIKLETVEVKTFEEEEDVLYQQRSKLFEYGEALLDKGTGVKSWKEKGVGDAKLLKHRESGKIRLLMRQEKTLKVLANHFVDPRINISVHGGNDKSYLWSAFDFADYELVEKTFAIRFGSPELARAFHDKFVDCQNENKSILAGADAASGAKEADEVAGALESLKVESSEPAAAAASEPEPAADAATAASDSATA